MASVIMVWACCALSHGRVLGGCWVGPLNWIGTGIGSSQALQFRSAIDSDLTRFFVEPQMIGGSIVKPC